VEYAPPFEKCRAGSFRLSFIGRGIVRKLALLEGEHDTLLVPCVIALLAERRVNRPASIRLQRPQKVYCLSILPNDACGCPKAGLWSAAHRL
jgi:hypothetical protein